MFFLHTTKKDSLGYLKENSMTRVTCILLRPKAMFTFHNKRASTLYVHI